MRDQDISAEPPVEDWAKLINSGFDNVIHKGASAQEIDDLQRELGANLPPSLRRFLEFTDGATLYQTDEFFGVKNRPDSPGIAEAMNILTAEARLPQGFLPFGRKGGLYYALDLNKPQPGGEYAVNLWNPKSGIRQEIAPSFRDHLRRVIAVHQEID